MVSAGAASLMSLGAGSSEALSAPGGAQVLEVSRSLFDHYRRLGQTVGPGFLLPGLIAQTHTLRETSTHADPRTRQQLLNGPVVQGRDITGDVGTVIKDSSGPVHTGQGDIDNNSRHISGGRHFSGLPVPTQNSARPSPLVSAMTGRNWAGRPSRRSGPAAAATAGAVSANQRRNRSAASR